MGFLPRKYQRRVERMLEQTDMPSFIGTSNSLRRPNALVVEAKAAGDLDKCAPETARKAASALDRINVSDEYQWRHLVGVRLSDCARLHMGMQRQYRETDEELRLRMNDLYESKYRSITDGFIQGS